jgi:hypothetical protein
MDATHEVLRLLGVIERNRARYDAMKATAAQWRDRALQAEAVVEELRRQRNPDFGGLDELFNFGRRR